LILLKAVLQRVRIDFCLRVWRVGKCLTLLRYAVGNAERGRDDPNVAHTAMLICLQDEVGCLTE
jgi:hypothetical protein